MTRADAPDPSEPDELEGLTTTEALDEDELAIDPLEGGMDPPERWSGADRYGTTAAEERTDRPLDSRLAEEQPDVPLSDAATRPVADTPLDELDESVDDGAADVPAEEARVITGTQVEVTGESSDHTEGRTLVEPDQPAADETVVIRDEDDL